MPNYYHFTPDRMCREFKDKINWKLYNIILYLLTTAEDRGNFLITYEVMIHDTAEHNFWTVYNSKDGWCALNMYDGIGNNSNSYFHIEILDKKSDRVYGQYLDYIREFLLKKYPDLKISHNMDCAYYAGYGEKTGYGGYSIDIKED